MGPPRRNRWVKLTKTNISDNSLNSASYGRPMMIADSQFDTKPYASMNDIDLRPGCKMPPLFPENREELTDTTYSTCKYYISVIIRKIIASVFGLHPPSYETIMKFDAQVRQVYDSFPSAIKHSPHFRDGGVTRCVQRLGIKVITCHALVILHRPFLYRSFKDPKYLPSRQKCMDAAHQILELFHEYRTNMEYVEYSWYALGALHAFHAGTVVGLRCYLEPLTCDERDWIAVEKARKEFERVSSVDGWNKLGEKAIKVFGILMRKALEKRAILEGALGSTGVTIGSTGTTPFEGVKFENYDTTTAFSIPSMSETPSNSSATGLTPQYPGPLFGTTNHYDPNPLTNPVLQAPEVFDPSRLRGAGMPGIVGTDQGNWDALWPKSMNLVHNIHLNVTNLD
jgi:hypothetical protein